MEWSGPAWYRVKTDDDGFPIEWKIVHFHPLNLGSHASTEWEAKDLAKILAKTYALTPSLSKAYIGLIHSHNTMGAFLSSTDTDTVQEMAPDNGFYGSLVVASAGKALHAFGIGYKDQYKVRHCFQADEDDIEIFHPKLSPMNEWIEEADIIEKNKPKPAFGTQYSLLHGQGRQKIRSVDDIAISKRGPGPHFHSLIEKKDAIFKKLSKKNREDAIKLLKLNDENQMTDIDTEDKLQKLGVNIVDITVLMDDGYDFSGLYGEYYGENNGYY